MGDIAPNNPYPVGSAAYNSTNATYTLGLATNPLNPTNPWQGQAAELSMQGMSVPQIQENIEEASQAQLVNVNAGCLPCGAAGGCDYGPFNAAPWPPKDPCAIANLGFSQIPYDWPDINSGYYAGVPKCPDGTPMSKTAPCPGKLVPSPVQGTGAYSQQLAAVVGGSAYSTQVVNRIPPSSPTNPLNAPPVNRTLTPAAQTNVLAPPAGSSNLTPGSVESTRNQSAGQDMGNNGGGGGASDITQWLKDNWILVAAGVGALILLPQLMKGGK